MLRLKLIGVNIIVGTEEFVELFCEVFWSIAHIYLHLILIRMLHSEREDKSNLLLWAELLYCFFNEILWLRRWTCTFLLLNSDYSRFNIKFIQIVACARVLNSKEHFKVFSCWYLSKRWIEIHSCWSWHPIIAHIAPVHNVPQKLLILDNLNLSWLHIKILKCFLVIKLSKFVLEFRSSKSFDRARY